MKLQITFDTQTYLGDVKGLDEHNDAGDDDGQKPDYVGRTDDIEDDVSWSSQGFGRENHFENARRRSRKAFEDVS